MIRLKSGVRRIRHSAAMRITVPALAILVAATFVATAQQLPPAPSATLGALVAERMCSYCHRIAPTRESDIEAGAPSFMEIANRPGRDAAFLRAFTTEIHLVTSVGNPPLVMPTAVLTPQSRDDVVAYIIGLKTTP